MLSLYSFLLTLVLVLHGLWIVFVISGWIYCARSCFWRRVHLVSVGYSVAIEISYFSCPLTDLENHLWERLGWSAYDEPFINHYARKTIYWDVPRELLICLAVLLLLITTVRYWAFTGAKSNSSQTVLARATHRCGRKL